MPAIVSRELFEAAQAQLDRNKRLAQRNARGARYLLQGLTVCAVCGYAFSGRSARGHAYYYCQGAHCRGEARVCRNRSVGGQPLDDHVWRSVCELLQDPARMLDEWLRRQRSGGMTAELQQQRDEASRALAAQERSLRRLVDAYEAGAIEVEDLKMRSDAVRTRLERARRELADAGQRLRQTTALRAIVTRLDDFAARVRTGLDALSWTERRLLVRTLVAKVEIDEKAATIVYRLPSTARTPTPPSEPEPDAEHGSKGERDPQCLLRSQRGRTVTRTGPALRLDGRRALRFTTRAVRVEEIKRQLANARAMVPERTGSAADDRFRAHEGALQKFLNGTSTKDALGQEQGITQDFLASSRP